MKEINLVIYDEDYCYVNEVINFINRRYVGYFKVIGVTNKEQLEKIISKGTAIDILLINESLIKVTEVISMIHTVIILSENKIYNDLEQRIIGKYQNGNSLINCVKKIYFGTKEEIDFNEQSVKTISFFSGSGGAGKTTISYLFAVDISKKGKKVLYINLEQISAFDSLFEDESESGLSDLLYKAADGIEINKSVFSKAIKRDPLTKMYYLDPVNCSIEIDDSTGDNITYVIEALKKCENYDFIVIDTGSRLDNTLKKLHDYSDEFICIAENNNLSISKSIKLIKEFINYESIRLIINKYNDGEKDVFRDYSEIEGKIESIIPFDTSIGNEVTADKLLNSKIINSKINEFIYKLMKEGYDF